ncbi:uncharacterized protein LOC122813771 [Protopterus annectens]|uniref:uncharacterized protein LOC122813771 n=1 Tax=Protopterus annectens TaxID=7888 RepID=UPI001CFBFB99|nr:uncharacterized protein LOC122813771 [Protopterus annectens]XP_043942201.1 uncharacterized protein LOC122813771 [Protopterus annectens]
MVQFSTLLYVSLITSVAAQFSVLITDKEVVGNVGDDLVIGCNFTKTGSFRSNFHIHWYYLKKDNKSTVHAYYGGADRLEDQDVAYQDRTQLFHSEFPNGNASLKLYKLETSDSGVYQCIVTNGQEQAHDNGSLKIHEVKTNEFSGGGVPLWLIIGIIAVILIIIFSIIIAFNMKTGGFYLYQRWRIFKIKRRISNYHGKSITIKVIGMKKHGGPSLVNSCYYVKFDLPLSDWAGAEADSYVKKPLTLELNLTDFIKIEKEEPMDDVQEDGTFWSSRKSYYIDKWRESNDLVFIFVIRNDYTTNDQTETEIQALFEDVKNLTGTFPLPVVTMKSLGTPKHMKSILENLGFHPVFNIDNYTQQNPQRNPRKDLTFLELLEACIEKEMKLKDSNENKHVS